MSREMQKTLGETFRQRREERHISIKEAENATSIRTNYLEAIEKGDFHQLISSVYAQGFVKQYAIFLGLDGEDIVRRNPEFFHHHRPTNQDFAYGIGTLEMRGNPGGGVRWFPDALWIGLAVVVLGVAFVLARYLGVF